MGFTGVDDPYEEPVRPELVIETDQETIEESMARIFAKLEELEYLEQLKLQNIPEEDSNIIC